MDARTRFLVQAIDDYLENPSPGTPKQLIENITSMKEMITAPRYSEESPGERAAREAAEQKSSDNGLTKELYESAELGDNTPAAI